MTDLADYCLSKSGAIEDYPFGDDVTVFKVGGKMFALLSPPAKPTRISLKCDPILAKILRQKYRGVAAGYHLNKTHWNSVALDGDVPEAEMQRMIDHSYILVLKKSKKK